MSSFPGQKPAVDFPPRRSHEPVEIHSPTSPLGLIVQTDEDASLVGVAPEPPSVVVGGRLVAGGFSLSGLIPQQSPFNGNDLVWLLFGESVFI